MSVFALLLMDNSDNVANIIFMLEITLYSQYRMVDNLIIYCNSNVFGLVNVVIILLQSE